MSEKEDESEKDILFLMLQPREMIEKWGVEREDPKLFRDALGIKDKAASLHTIHGVEDRIPEVKEEFDGVIMGGSSYCIYDDKEWIHELEDFVKELIVRKIPTLGICFGHQIIMKALGGRVVSDTPVYEVGAANITLTEAGKSDPVFKGLEDEFSIISSHRDNVVTVPDYSDIDVLAKSDLYPHQSVAVGENIRTLQFHPEFDPKVVESIMDSNREHVLDAGIFKNEDQLDSYIKRMKKKEEQIVKNGRKILDNFYNHFL